jgi:hypothetical protein
MATDDYDWLRELINERLEEQNWGQEFDEDDIDCIEVSEAAEKLIKEIDASIAAQVNDLEEDDDTEEEPLDEEDEEEEDEEDDEWLQYG